MNGTSSFYMVRQQYKYTMYETSLETKREKKKKKKRLVFFSLFFLHLKAGAVKVGLKSRTNCIMLSPTYKPRNKIQTRHKRKQNTTLKWSKQMGHRHKTAFCVYLPIYIKHQLSLPYLLNLGSPLKDQPSQIRSFICSTVEQMQAGKVLLYICL